MTGLKELWTGESEKSIAGRVIEKSFLKAGATEIQAERRAQVVEGGLLVAIGGVAGASGLSDDAARFMATEPFDSGRVAFSSGRPLGTEIASGVPSASAIDGEVSPATPVETAPPAPLTGTQNPAVAWAAKTGRAYDRRVTRFWRQYEGQTVGDWTVESVNRRLATGVQPDLVLVNESKKTIIIHDVTSKAVESHLAKGAGYKRFFEAQRPGYTVSYSEGYWEGLENSWEALSKKGDLYLPGSAKPPRTP
jgi:hypothetical protein